MKAETREIITTATIYAIHATRTYSLTRIEVGDRLAEDLRALHSTSNGRAVVRSGNVPRELRSRLAHRIHSDLD